MKSFVIVISLLSVLSTGSFASTVTKNSQSKHQSAVSKLLAKKPVQPQIVLAPIKVTAKSQVAPIVKKTVIQKVPVCKPIYIKSKPIVVTLSVEEKLTVQRLLEMVEEMSPTQAMEFQTKLSSKVFSPVYKGFMNGVDVSMAGALRLASLTGINNTYGATLGNMGTLIESNFEGTWPLADDLRFGLRFASGQNSATKKTASTVYEDLSIRYSSLGGYLRWDLIREPSFIVATEVGLGYVLGEYAYSKVDESGVSPNLQTVRQGGVVAVNIGLMTMWNINPVWRWGVGVSYELANIKDLRRSNATDPSSPALDLSGIDVALSTTLLF